MSEFNAPLTKEEMLKQPIMTIYRLPVVEGVMLPGVIYDHRTVKTGFPFAITGEHPTKHITKGIKRCIKTHYHRGNYPTFEILEEGRSRILFHKMNDPEKESEGCIGIAEFFGEVLGRTVIADSAGGFREFIMRAKDYDEFLIEIVEYGVFHD